MCKQFGAKVSRQARSGVREIRVRRAGRQVGMQAAMQATSQMAERGRRRSKG